MHYTGNHYSPSPVQLSGQMRHRDRSGGSELAVNVGDEKGGKQYINSS